MLWSLVLCSGIMELAYGATSMDKTVQHKLTKVRNVTDEIDQAAKQVMVLQDKNWLPGSPETKKATAQLQALLQAAEQTNTQLQMGLGTVKGKAAAAQMKLDQAKTVSSAACQVSSLCDLASSKVADVRITELKEMLQDFEITNNWDLGFYGHEGDVGASQQRTMHNVEEQKRTFAKDLVEAAVQEHEQCKKEYGEYPKTLTKCQKALNGTIAAEIQKVLAQETVDACTESAEKLSVSIKRAEELVRPLVLGEESRLYGTRMRGHFQHLSPAPRWPWAAENSSLLLMLSLLMMFASLSALAVMVRSRIARDSTRALTEEELLNE